MGLADNDSAARQHLVAGVEAYKAGLRDRKVGDQERAAANFRRSIDEYKLSYEAAADPQALFGLAQAHRALGELKRALALYEDYLRQDPKGPNADAARKLVPELREQVERAAATETAPPTGAPISKEPATPASPRKEALASKTPTTASTPPEQAPAASTKPPTVESPAAPAAPPAPSPIMKGSGVAPGRTKRIAAYALFGLTGAALIGGIIAGVLGGQAADSINQEKQLGQPFDPSKESAGKTDNLVMGVMYGVAGAAAVSGAVLLYLGIRESRAGSRGSVAVAPMLAPGLQGATLVIHF